MPLHSLEVAYGFLPAVTVSECTKKDCLSPSGSHQLKITGKDGLPPTLWHTESIATQSTHQTWTAAFMTRLGLSMLLPSARRLFCHFRLAARTARMMASEDPTVLTPRAFSLLTRGALKSLATMLTHRLSISPSDGYSSLFECAESLVAQ